MFCSFLRKHLHFSHHLQDFLRQNNTGKILWQVFGVEAATLCLFGISEHEEIMWNSFKLAGLPIYSNQWCLWWLFYDIVR